MNLICSGRRLRMSLSLLVLLSVSGVAQAQNPVLVVPDGTLIRAKVKGKYDTRTVKVGDPIILVVAQEVKDANGKILIPLNAKLVGHIVVAQPYEANRSEAQLSWLVDHAEIHRNRVSLHASPYLLEMLAFYYATGPVPPMTRPVMSGQNADVRDVQKPGGATERPVLNPDPTNARSGPTRNYRLAHVTLSPVDGSAGRKMLVSKLADIKLTAEDVIIMLRHSQP